MLAYAKNDYAAFRKHFFIIFCARMTFLYA